MSSLLNSLIELIIFGAFVVALRFLSNINKNNLGLFFTRVHLLITIILFSLGMFSAILFSLFGIFIFHFPDWFGHRLVQLSIAVLILVVLLDYKKIREYTNMP